MSQHGANLKLGRTLQHSTTTEIFKPKRPNKRLNKTRATNQAPPPSRPQPPQSCPLAPRYVERPRLTHRSPPKKHGWRPRVAWISSWVGFAWVKLDIQKKLCLFFCGICCLVIHYSSVTSPSIGPSMQKSFYRGHSSGRVDPQKGLYGCSRKNGEDEFVQHFLGPKQTEPPFSDSTPLSHLLSRCCALLHLPANIRHDSSASGSQLLI